MGGILGIFLPFLPGEGKMNGKMIGKMIGIQRFFSFSFFVNFGGIERDLEGLAMICEDSFL